MYIGLHAKYPPFLSDFNETLNFLNRFLKNIQIPNFVKIRPLAADLFCSGGQMGRHEEADSCPSQFCERDIKKTFTSHLQNYLCS
jgi:hypothetical protein